MGTLLTALSRAFNIYLLSLILGVQIGLTFFHI